MIIHPNGVAAIKGDTHHNIWVREQGLIHDKFMEKVIRDLIAEFDVKVAVDGGANIGTLTAVMLDCGVETWAFEPNEQALECLRHNCPGARIEPFGLSYAAESKVLVRDKNAGASFIDQSPEAKGETVELIPLYAYGFCPDLIKLDVEGFEVNAIIGGLDMIRSSAPVIVCEVNEAALRRAGYSGLALRCLLDGLGYNITIAQPDCTFDSPQYDIIAEP